MNVQDIQRALVARGFDLGKGGRAKDGVDGDFGDLTFDALKAFQARARADGWHLAGRGCDASAGRAGAAAVSERAGGACIVDADGKNAAHHPPLERRHQQGERPRQEP
ncbi:peptidoglycan-binding domain-containing protein [Chelatococcus reniformis]|uniref:peptidoglycan-binding domain-containing protein n=1 Tax=Chelatococcus reniformis TaxID=1494448 RepID=UPI001FCE4B84|nr:peptidoglycan-binding domain-containing protein [Chelatococcus reniformis]